jgi:hypothetical protein
MIFKLGEKYRIYPPGSLWTYEGIDVGEHVFTMAEGKVSWKIAPHFLKFYKIVEDASS